MTGSTIQEYPDGWYVLTARPDTGTPIRVGPFSTAGKAAMWAMLRGL